MYRLSRTIPVNEAGKVYLSRHDVWTGLMMKAQNALPYVPQMQKCAVLEEGAGWLLRDIVFNNTPLRERVTFEPETRVVFERVETGIVIDLPPRAAQPCVIGLGFLPTCRQLLLKRRRRRSAGTLILQADHAGV